MPATGRKLHLPLIHEISVVVNQNTPQGAGNTFIIGWLPPGAVLSIARVAPQVAFNSAGAATVSLGVTPGGNEFLSAIDLKTLARTETFVPAITAGPLSLHTPIYATIVGGTGATAGQATVWLEYIPTVDLGGIAARTARKTQYQAPHYISGQGGFGQLSGQIGTIPAGAILNMFHTLTSQAFDSTTNTLSIGTTPGGTNILNAGNVKPVGRSDVVVAAAAMGPYAAEQPIYYTLASTGPAPTAGVISVWLDYLPGPG